MKFATTDKPSFRPTCGATRQTLTAVDCRLKENGRRFAKGRGRNARGLSQIDGKAFEIAERAISQRRLVGGAQDHARWVSGFEGFLPALRAQAPAIAGFETGKTDLRYRRRQIVAARFGESEKGVGYHHANRMAAHVLTAGVAAAVPVKARHRLDRAKFKRFAEDIARGKTRSPFFFSVVSQH